MFTGGRALVNCVAGFAALPIFAAMDARPSITPDDFRRLYDEFQAAISRFDCGRYCAPLNGGEPVCCSTQHAVPVVHRAEWKLLAERTDLWRRFKPYDAATRKIVAELPDDCCAIECKGPRHCERDNRTLACRAFPFFPYITRASDFVGLAHYWDYEDRCWMISNLQAVTRDFVGQFVRAWERVFALDPSEYETMREHSACMRRVFTRWNRIIPLIGRDGDYLKVLPRGGAIRPAKATEFRPRPPFRTEKEYARAVKEAGGTPPPGGLGR